MRADTTERAMTRRTSRGTNARLPRGLVVLLRLAARLCSDGSVARHDPVPYPTHVMTRKPPPTHHTPHSVMTGLSLAARRGAPWRGPSHHIPLHYITLAGSFSLYYITLYYIGRVLLITLHYIILYYIILYYITLT